MVRRFYVRGRIETACRRMDSGKKNEAPALQLRTPRRAKYPLLLNQSSATLGEPSSPRLTTFVDWDGKDSACFTGEATFKLSI